jgi:hypothetical protein
MKKPDVKVHEGHQAGVVVSVRLKPDEANLLEALAERDGRSLSETLRIALHEFSRMPRHGEMSPFTRGGSSPELDEVRAAAPAHSG